MRRNLIAAALVATGLALMGMAVSSMGMFSAPAALPAQVGAPARAVPMTGPQRDPTSLAGVQNANVPADPNTAVATLIIPALKVRAPIFERGLDPKGNMLIAHGYAVTQFQYSALIGAGNTVLYGHDDIEGSVFGRLQDLKPGDQIVIMLARSGESIVWRVTARTIVAPTAVEILNPTHDVRLTLFTCWPTWVDTKRVVITAVQA